MDNVDIPVLSFKTNIIPMHSTIRGARYYAQGGHFQSERWVNYILD